MPPEAIPPEHRLAAYAGNVRPHKPVGKKKAAYMASA